jgi:predicted lipoprotein
VQKAVEGKAVDATTLAAAIAADASAAGKKYGVQGNTAPEVSVKFTGVLGEGASGVYPVTVDGLPATTLVRVQTGPAVNGTDLRDATGKITFGQFTNQIEYQDAGSALNNELKAEVLAKYEGQDLKGKTVSVVGVFQLINPNGWLVTPVKLDVQ